MGFSASMRNMETGQGRYIDVPTRTHVNGCWRIREQTQCWNTSEQEVANKDTVDCIHQRTCYRITDHGQQKKIMLMSVTSLTRDVRIIMSKKHTEQLSNSLNPRKTSKLWVKTSTLNLVLVLILNVTVLVNTRSNDSNKRGDWMKQWLMVQEFVAFINHFFKKNT